MLLRLFGMSNDSGNVSPVKDLFPENMELKFFRQTIDESDIKGFYGTVHVLMCPVLNEDLHKELLCGLDERYSTRNVVIYSGFTKNLKTDLNVFCIDLVVENSLKRFNTQYLWHGKCFTSTSQPTEYLFPHNISFIDGKEKAIYELNKNQKILYKASLPALNDTNYETHDIKDDEYLTTSHFHLFENFYTKEIKEYCPANAYLNTGIMTINFGKMDKTYNKKLNNLDDIFIDDNLGKHFGFKAPFNKKSFDNTNCVASFWHDLGLMETGRILAVDKNSQVPPLKSDKSLSTTKTLPEPYVNMKAKLIEQMRTLTEKQRTKSFDINNAIMDVFYQNQP